MLIQELQPGKCEPFGCLVSHVDKSSKDGDACLCRKGSRVDGSDDNFFQLLIEELCATADVHVDVSVKTSENLKKSKEVLDCERLNNLHNIE